MRDWGQDEKGTTEDEMLDGVDVPNMSKGIFEWEGDLDHEGGHSVITGTL